MNKPIRFTVISLLLALSMLVWAGAAIGAEISEQAKAKAEAKEKSKTEKKAEEAEKLKQKKEEAERIKRQKAEEARQKAQAREAAKAEQERLAKIDADAKAQAKAEIAQAKEQMKARMAELDEKAKQQKEEAKVKLEQIKSKYQMDKDALAAEYKDKIAAAEGQDKASLETECKAKQFDLSEQYKYDVTSVKQMQAEQKAQISEQKTVLENEYEASVAKANAKARLTSAMARTMDIALPQDNTPKMDVRNIQIEGNILITDAEIIDQMPLIWSASGQPLSQSKSEDLYDFRVLNEIILEPGAPRQVSTRTVQGLMAFILSLYQEKNFAGISVYVPQSATVSANQLKDDILLVEVLEAPVTTVTVRSYDADHNVKEKGYLRRSFVEEWSPVKAGEVANEKELNDFVNLLNLNPDLYVQPVFKKGAQPKSLQVDYDIYEINPWHWFIQLDNAGTRDRQWTPRVGVINTNLLGVDDSFIAIYQAPWDKDIEDQYSVFGSYDIPILGPKLRFQVYAGYSQYDINPDSGPFDFIGNGHFVGGILRYNVLQTDIGTPVVGDGWFFDVKGMVEYDRSKFTPSLADVNSVPGSDVRFWLWGWGLELHRRTDMSNSQIGFDYWQSGMGQSDAAAFNRARTGAETDFSLYEFNARHSQYLDPNKVQRLSGNVRWVITDDRLVPAKMTSFGGMYTVRGYEEYEIVADSGILASAQYEYDLVAADNAMMTQQEKRQKLHQEKDPLEIRKAAPLLFFDYGRATTVHTVHTIGENKHTELMSAGIGALLDIGDNFSGAVYYGYPLRATENTREGKGRVNVNFLLKW
jgi:hemolysin activation/secretion protein